MTFKKIGYVLVLIWVLIFASACVPSPEDPPPATSPVVNTPTPDKYLIDPNSVVPLITDQDAGQYNQLIVDPIKNAADGNDVYVAYVVDGKTINLIDIANNTVVMPIATTLTSFGPIAASVSVQNSKSVLDVVYFEATVGLKHTRALIENLTSTYVWGPTIIAGTSGASDDNMTIGLVSDNATNLYLSFFDKTASSLSFARYDGNATIPTWSAVETVDLPVVAGDVVGRYSSMALDDMNQPHIAYYYNTALNGNGNLKYANYDKAAAIWNKTTLLSTGENGKFPVISQSSGDNATSTSDDVFDIVYYNAAATGGSIQWLNSTRGFTASQAVKLDSWDTGNSTIIAMGSASDGALFAAYHKNNEVRFVAFSVISPRLQTVENVLTSGGDFVSLGVDSNGAAHMAYYDPTDKDLKYARTKAP